MTPWTVTCQAPLSMEFPRQEHWSGLPFLTPGDCPDPGIKAIFPAWQADSLPLSHLGRPYIHMYIYMFIYSFSDSFSFIGYYKLLNIVPWAM